MTIPCNRNITKQLNSYSLRISITLQFTKRALSWVKSISSDWWIKCTPLAITCTQK